MGMFGYSNRSYRGCHERDYIEVDTSWDLDRINYYYVENEQKNPNGKGTFGTIQTSYTAKYVVVWRPTRNHTRSWDTYAMRDPLNKREVVTYDTVDAAVASFQAWAGIFEIPEQYTKKRRRTRDAQKSKVYSWEHKMAKDIGTTEEVFAGRIGKTHTYVQKNKLELRRSHKLLKDALDHVCHNLGEEAPELKFRSGGKHSFGGFRIRLLPCHCNYLVLMHEFAHVLHNRWYSDRTGHQAHGKEFVGIYMYLLIRFFEVDADDLFRHAADAKIKFELPVRYYDWIRFQESKAA